uniref:RNA exonuclease 4 n=1 Tax=Timema genevievae TaxID=629358 RepID=A0A7R9KBI1_TIMGE|nr:unnamed protein product [Timema genevievae]
MNYTKRNKQDGSVKVFTKPSVEITNKVTLLANITHKKNAISCNWKHFKQTFGQIKEENKTSTQKEDKPFAEERYTGPFRKRRKAAVTIDIPHVIQQEETNPEPDLMPVLSKSNNTRVKNIKLTRHIAMDCEMVGVEDGNDSILARVSLVNKFGDCVYDKFVKATEPVVDYRTHVSGVRPKDMEQGESFETVQKEVADLLKGRILVGHALSNDLKVLFLGHPKRHIRDTSRYKPFRKLTRGWTPGLRTLAAKVLGVTIQQGEHSSVVDARTAMQLYMLYRKEWERGLHSKKKNSADRTVKPRLAVK